MRGISALALAGKIAVCYETAWNLLRRIRTAMERRDEHYVLGQIVEFDDACFGGKIKGVRGRGAGNQGVFIAVAKNEKGEPTYLKMKVTDNVRIPSVTGFAERNIASGAVAQTDGFKSYRKPLKNGYIHKAPDFYPNSEHLKRLRRINGTYHGAGTKHLQMYLSEFCYRFTRRLFGCAVFDRLLIAIAG